MTTRAVRDGDDWVINGRKIWISRAADADFTILMAVTDTEKRARGGISAFLVDKGTPGFNVLRRIPMVGGAATYEVALEDCRVEGWKLLGQEGAGSRRCRRGWGRGGSRWRRGRSGWRSGRWT